MMGETYFDPEIRLDVSFFGGDNRLVIVFLTFCQPNLQHQIKKSNKLDSNHIGHVKQKNAFKRAKCADSDYPAHSHHFLCIYAFCSINPLTANHNNCHLLCHLLVNLKVISANSVDPDQTALCGSV